MKNTKTSIILIVSIMVIVGTTLTPTLNQRVTAAAIEARSQHIDQENLCFRANTCRQSDTGQNTLGNDNQVTGFADQSDNLQQSTTANKTTPTPTPTPTRTTASLTVTKIVTGTTNVTSSDFTMHVTGNNPTPANFAGSSAGIDVTLGAGAFVVTETGPTSRFNTTTTGECSGTIAAGQHLTCTIINTPNLTCEECFTSLLTTAQIAELVPFIGTTSQFCADHTIFATEDQFRSLIIGAGSDLTTANKLITCLKAAGLVFAT